MENAGLRIAELQEELTAQQTAGQAAADGYEAEIARLDGERAAAIAWGQAKDTELEASRAEFAKCLALFQQAEMTIEERTLWAQSLAAEIDNLRAQLESVRASKWVRLGRSIGIGPKVR